MPSDVTDGNPAPWNRNDAETFEDDEKQCAACGQPFAVGEVVQERPAFSLHFYHVNTRDCPAITEEAP